MLADRAMRSSMSPTAATSSAPTMMPANAGAGIWWGAPAAHAAPANPAMMAIPPQVGSGRSWSLRSSGLSMAPPCSASFRARGVAAQVTAAPTM